jgi:hypothetical protein
MNRLAVVGGLAVVALLAAGCAGTRVAATEKLAAAQRAIGDATQTEAAIVAPGDLRSAEAKLGQAQTAANDWRWKEAGRLADEAYADAEYARAQALTQRARKSTEDMRQNVQLLRRELERTGR